MQRTQHLTTVHSLGNYLINRKPQVPGLHKKSISLPLKKINITKYSSHSNMALALIGTRVLKGKSKNTF